MGNKIKRKLSTELYHAAAFYTIILLIIGFLAGVVYDKYLTDNLRNNITSISDFSFTSEILYALEGTDEFCEIYPYTIKRVEEETWRIGVILDQLESDHRLPEDLKLKYFDMELREKKKKKRAFTACNISSIVLIYFYTNDVDKCFKCSSEGFELTIARKNLIDKNYSIKVYAFDGEVDHSIVKYLKKKYMIKEYPSIVVLYKNKAKVLEGFNTADEIVKEIDILKSQSFSESSFS